MISDFKNRHLGDTCIIVGNGRSLNLIPRDFLDLYPTFGQNAIYLMRDFSPTYYVAADPSNLDANEINNIKCPKFVREGSGLDNCHEFRLTRQHIFSKHPDIVLYEGYSVTFVSLQLAYYMGFTTVLLVGVDHRYIPYDIDKESDPNHFIDTYGGITDWSPQSLAKGAKFIVEAMLLAKVAYENDGRRIINLTQGSNLKVFQIDNINNWYQPIG